MAQQLERLVAQEDWRDALVDRTDILVAASHALMLEHGLSAVDVDNGNKQVTDARMVREWQSKEIARMTYAPISGGSLVSLTLVRLGDVVVANLVPPGSDKPIASVDLAVSDFFQRSLAAEAPIADLIKGFLQEKFSLVFRTRLGSSLPQSQSIPNRAATVTWRDRGPQQPPSRSPLYEPPRGNPYYHGPPTGAFPSFGSGDLDPFHRGSGMFAGPHPGGFDPFAPSPSFGGPPPGARFDPFGPPIGSFPSPTGMFPGQGGRPRGGRPGGIGGEPDPDNLRAPDRFDDMYS